MGLDQDIRKRARVYSFMSHELSFVGMTLWEFCQAIMQFPEDARIYDIRNSLDTGAIEIAVGSKEFDEVKLGYELPYYYYDRSVRTFVRVDK